MKRFDLISSLASVALAGMLGCGAEDLTPDAQDAIKITPGGEEIAGSIQVNLPTGMVASDGKTTFTYRGAALSAGVAARFASGTGALTLSSAALLPGGGNVEPGVAVVQRQTTAYNLSALKPSWNTSTTTVDFGPAARLSGSRLAGGAWGKIFEQGQQTWDNTGATAILVHPGSYSFTWNVPALDPIAFDLTPGATQPVSLTPADRRATIKIAQPVREFPHAKSASYPQCTNNTGYLVQRNRDLPNAAGPGTSPASEGVIAFQGNVANPRTEYRVFPFVAAEAPMHYEYIVNNTSYRVDVKAGDVVTVPVDRIDVDDVQVVNERNEVKSVPGQYKLFRQGANNVWTAVSIWDRQTGCSNVTTYLEGPFPTRTGIDVLPGTYKVVTTYQTLEGAKTTEQVVTIP